MTVQSCHKNKVHFSSLKIQLTIQARNGWRDLPSEQRHSMMQSHFLDPTGQNVHVDGPNWRKLVVATHRQFLWRKSQKAIEMDLDALGAHLKFIRGKSDDFILAKRSEIEAEPQKYNAKVSSSGVITLWVRMLPEVAADDILLVSSKIDESLKEIESGFDMAKLLDMDDPTASQLHANVSGTSTMVGCVNNAVAGAADIAEEVTIGRRRGAVRHASDCQSWTQRLQKNAPSSSSAQEMISTERLLQRDCQPWAPHFNSREIIAE
jgi:hypothetical protein